MIKNIKAYIFGSHQNFFINKLKKKINYQLFFDLKSLINKVFLDVKNDRTLACKIILFSPASASFDNFKNFEERGRYFNKLIRKYI